MKHESPRADRPAYSYEYDGIPGAIDEEARPGAIKQSSDRVHAFFNYFCNGVLAVDTPNAMVQYWSQSEHCVIFDRPNAAFVLVNNFFIVAHRYLTEGVEGVDCLKCANRIIVNTFFIMQCLVSACQNSMLCSVTPRLI